MRRFIGLLALLLTVSSASYMAYLLMPQAMLAAVGQRARLSGILLAIHAPTPYLWPVRSVDTMKYSRDLARQQETSPKFDAGISAQMQEIAATGATHVAIDTPYDPEFLPVLTRWVAAARAAHLHVWFRGNWSGWEQWFGYAKMTPDEHSAKTVAFIHDNPSLFQNGDIFTACPECENGALGDPRQTGNVDAFRQFMLTEYTDTQTAFKAQHKQIITNYSAMNYDVANLVYTRQFAAQMGGVVPVDHYVASPAQLADNLTTLSQKTGAKVVLGEFGAPIPDLHGQMTEAQQASWIGTVLDALKNNRSVIAVNYWVNLGGSTALWNDGLTPRAAVATLTRAYTPAK